eukprot:10254438-Lingulodinium_polyedra.AAC.1
MPAPRAASPLRRVSGIPALQTELVCRGALAPPARPRSLGVRRTQRGRRRRERSVHKPLLPLQRRRVVDP